MRSSALVTCIYNGLSDTKYGGRNRDSMYKDSLVSIAECGLPIFCYSFLEHVEELHDYFTTHGVHNIEVVPYDILSEDFHTGIMSIKNRHPDVYYNGDVFWRHRCPEIMWSKTRLIRHTLANNKCLSKIYWIDAGLSNASILRHKYFPRYETYEHYRSAGFFTNDLFEALDKHSDNGMFAAFHTRPNNARIPDHFNRKPYGTMYYAMIGGLFGGNISQMLTFCSIFETYIDKMLQSDVLYSEESVYTGISNDNPDLFNPMVFDTFYNEDWGEIYSPSEISFAKIFDKLLSARQSTFSENF